jgi:hypothetical protein
MLCDGWTDTMGCASSSENDPKAQAEKLVTLDKTILGKYLSQEQLTALAEYFTVETYGENRLIFGQNDGTADALYIIAEGEGLSCLPALTCFLSTLP